jgi:L-iditol 2-dehydrogenase
VKVALLTGTRQIEIRDTPEPALRGPEDVMVRIEAVGVCGSDIHYYTEGRIGSQIVRFPEIIGHECAGTVAEAGSSVGEPRIGQRVAIDPLIPCGQCDQCRAGRQNTCRRQTFLGCPGQAAGGLAEYIVMPARCCYTVPESMSAAQAAMVEPFAVALHSVRIARLKPGAKIAILGAGPIGLSVLLACRAAAEDSNSRVYVTDLIDERVQAARQCGADWAGNPLHEDIQATIGDKEPLGLDFVFECAGKQETLDQSAGLLKPGGTLLIVGIPEVDRISFDPHLLRRHELEVRNVRRQNDCVQPAIEMISSGAVNVDQLVTHRFPLTETKKAFDLVASYRDGVIKAMIETAPDH